MNIAIDVDEVLSDSLNKIIEFHNEKYGTSLIKDQFKMWGYHNVWGGTIEEEAKKLAAFYETESFREMKPINGSVEGVKKLSSSNDLYVITSRPVQVLDETKRWLKQYYQDAFTEVICTNNWAKNGKKTPKMQFVKN